MRKEDLVDLARHLIKKFNQEYGRNVEEIDLEAIQTLHQYSWPGNVRELENVLGRAMINMEFNERVMRKKHLPPLDLSRAKEGQDLEGRLESGTDIQPLKDVIQQFEKII